MWSGLRLFLKELLYFIPFSQSITLSLFSFFPADRIYYDIPITSSSATSQSQWSAYFQQSILDPSTPHKASLCVYSPPNAIVGVYELYLLFMSHYGSSSCRVGQFTLLCNPWCTGEPGNISSNTFEVTLYSSLNHSATTQWHCSVSYHLSSIIYMFIWVGNITQDTKVVCGLFSWLCVLAWRNSEGRVCEERLWPVVPGHSQKHQL